mgnify:CR=1 FL=1
MIPFCDVCQIGSDIILVSFKEKEKAEELVKMLSEPKPIKAVVEKIERKKEEKIP